MTGDVLSLDENTRRLGMLMETAHAHQELADDCLRRLHVHTEGIDEVIRDEIRRAFIGEFGALIEESTRAADVLRGLGRLTNLRVACWGALIGVVAGVMVFLLMRCWLPPPQRMVALKAEHAQLSASIAPLTDSGGRIDLRRCGNASRLCVRIDRRAPAYGEQADYLIVRGY